MDESVMRAARFIADQMLQRVSLQTRKKAFSIWDHNMRYTRHNAWLALHQQAPELWQQAWSSGFPVVEKFANELFLQRKNK